MTVARSSICKAGLVHDLAMADYVSDPCPEPSLSASCIRKINDKSPLSAWFYHPRLGGESTYSRAADFGSAAHAIVLEGPAAVEVIVGFADYRKKDAKVLRDEIRERGKIPILEHEAEAVYTMAKAAREAIINEVGPGKAEVTAIWQEKNGVWGRSRSDWLANDSPYVVDYKTTKNAEPSEWERRVLFKAGYDFSAAWYIRGLRWLGREIKEYKWLVQETEPPYDYSWHGAEFGSELLDVPGKIIRKAVKTWGECLKSGKYPGYLKHTHYPEPPAWRAVQFEDSELAEEMAREVFGGE